LNTANLEGAPDGAAHAHGDRLRLGPTGLTSVEPRARNLYALPTWGILVIRCEEKTVIADSGPSCGGSISCAGLRSRSWCAGPSCRGTQSGRRCGRRCLRCSRCLSAVETGSVQAPSAPATCRYSLSLLVLLVGVTILAVAVAVAVADTDWGAAAEFGSRRLATHAECPGWRQSSAARTRPPVGRLSAAQVSIRPSSLQCNPWRAPWR
jgi:hypothetical protein